MPDTDTAAVRCRTDDTPVRIYNRYVRLSCSGMSKVCESCGRNRPERFGLSDHPDGSRAGSLSFPKRSMAVTAKLIPLRAQNSSWMGRLQESTFTAIRFRAEAMSTGEVCEAYTLYLTSFHIDYRQTATIGAHTFALPGFCANFPDVPVGYCPGCYKPMAVPGRVIYVFQEIKQAFVVVVQIRVTEESLSSEIQRSREIQLTGNILQRPVFFLRTEEVDTHPGRPVGRSRFLSSR